MILQALRLACTAVLGAIFVASALGKFHNPAAFLRSIIDYRMTPLWMSYATAVTLPGMELLAGAVLLAGFLAGAVRLRTSRREMLVTVGLDVTARPGWLRKLDVWVDAAAWICAGMLVFFMALLSIAILRGLELDCGCFDFIGEHISFLRSSKVDWGTVWRDAVMLLLAVPIILRRLPRR